MYFSLGMDSQNETLNFINLLEDMYNEYMMETPNMEVMWKVLVQMWK